MNELEKLRIEVDKSNKKIIEEISNRFLITRKIGKIKASQNIVSFDKNREDIVLENVGNLARNNNLNENMIKEIFKIIMKEVVLEHNKIKENNVNKKNK